VRKENTRGNWKIKEIILPQTSHRNSVEGNSMRLKRGQKMIISAYGISSSNGLEWDTYIKFNRTTLLSYRRSAKCEVKATSLTVGFKIHAA